MAADRYPLLDSIRGLAVVNMVLFHFLYDVCIIYGRMPDWYQRPIVRFWQQAICWTFLLVAGFVWRWGQATNLRRGLFFSLCGAGISLVTWLVVPSEAIWCGILSFMGCTVLLMQPLHRWLRHCPPKPGMLVSFTAFLLTRSVSQGCLRIGHWTLAQLPDWLYRWKLLTPLGFPYDGFRSSDYFPLVPWVFLFLTGYFASLLFEQREDWKAFARKSLPSLSAIGQKSIWVYLAHQPLNMVVCALLFA
jgi:uncharacterized membrane protein